MLMKLRCHNTAPLPGAALTAYTLACSVATKTTFGLPLAPARRLTALSPGLAPIGTSCSTSGWAYTWPSTPVTDSLPKEEELTLACVRTVSLAFRPVDELP